jgi:hypothetical protein
MSIHSICTYIYIHDGNWPMIIEAHWHKSEGLRTRSSDVSSQEEREFTLPLPFCYILTPNRIEDTSSYW